MEIIFLILWPFLFIITLAAAIVGFIFLITYIAKYIEHKTPRYRNRLIATIIVWIIVLILLAVTTWYFIDICRQLSEGFHQRIPDRSTTTHALALFLKTK